MRTSLFLIASLLGACTLGTSTGGENHKVDFTYESCFFGCAVDQPMMIGTEERIDIKASSIPAVTVRSTNESVLAIHDSSRGCCATDGTCRTTTTSDTCNADETPSLTVTVDAVAAGTASLELDRNGVLYDAVALTVKPAASLALTCANQPGPIALRVGNSCGVGWTASGADGKPLMATTGVTLTTSDPKVFQLETLLGAPQNSIESSQAFLAGTSVIATGAGDATLTATAGPISSGVAVHVSP